MIKNYFVKKLFYLSIILLSPFMNDLSSNAEELNNQKKEDIKRFSIEGGLGLNFFLPFAHARLGYIIPTEKNSIQLTLEYAFKNAAMSFSESQAFLLGVNYYFRDRNWFNPFLSAGVLSSFYLPSKVSNFTSYSGETLCLGIGSDIMFTENFGISGMVNFSTLYRDNQSNNIGFSFAPRPEINIKVAF